MIFTRRVLTLTGKAVHISEDVIWDGTWWSGMTQCGRRVSQVASAYDFSDDDGAFVSTDRPIDCSRCRSFVESRIRLLQGCLEGSSS